MPPYFIPHCLSDRQRIKQRDTLYNRHPLAFFHYPSHSESWEIKHLLNCHIQLNNLINSDWIYRTTSALSLSDFNSFLTKIWSFYFLMKADSLSPLMWFYETINDSHFRSAIYLNVSLNIKSVLSRRSCFIELLFKFERHLDRFMDRKGL